jgi:hypothetical protein
VLATVGPALVVSWGWLLVTEGALTRRGDLLDGLRLVLGPGAIMRKVLLGMPPVSTPSQDVDVVVTEHGAVRPARQDPRGTRCRAGRPLVRGRRPLALVSGEVWVGERGDGHPAQ